MRFKWESRTGDRKPARNGWNQQQQKVEIIWHIPRREISNVLPQVKTNFLNVSSRDRDRTAHLKAVKAIIQHYLVKLEMALEQLNKAYERDLQESCPLQSSPQSRRNWGGDEEGYLVGKKRNGQG